MKEWMKNIRQVEPYIPGEQPKDMGRIIKLNTNESPYPPAPGVENALEAFSYDSLRLYPDPDSSSLVNVLAEYYQLEPSQVFVGVGSDDVLATAFLTFFNGEDPILFPDITYSFYDVWANLYRIPFVQLPVDGEYHIRKEDYRRVNGGIIFPNPNAPTAICEPLSFIEDVLVHNPNVVVIIDEAYIDFGGESAVSLIEKYDNLLVVQTFSKSRSMAGMRIGYAMGNPELIAAMNAIKNSYNSYTMNRTSLELGVEAVKDEAYFRECTEKVIHTREEAKKRLAELGFVMTDSKTNFLFAEHPKKDAGEIFRELKKRGIYVRYWNKPRINQRLRISIGTDEEMEELYKALAEIL